MTIICTVGGLLSCPYNHSSTWQNVCDRCTWCSQTFITGKCLLFCLLKWPSLDEYVSLCICLLTIACNREIKPLFFLFFLAVLCGGGGGLSGPGSKCNCAAWVGLGQVRSDDIRYRLGSGFSLKPVQTSSRPGESLQRKYFSNRPFDRPGILKSGSRDPLSCRF